MDQAIIDSFHQTALLRRSDLFTDDKLMPLTAQEDASVAAAGWVGANWQGGTLLVGINPGGGGDEYRRNPTDDRLYDSLRAFRDATPTDLAAKFAEVGLVWSEMQQGHNIWRIIRPILEATGEQREQIAFMNILPFRTRMDAKAPANVLSLAWLRAAEPQIRALRPARIIALGKKAWDILSRFPTPMNAELILFKRGIGDSYIPKESQQVLTDLAKHRVALSKK